MAMYFIGDPKLLPERDSIKFVSPKTLTVFVDLDETLVDARTCSCIKLRPYAREFIKHLSESHIEVIIWSAGEESHVRICCEELDPDHLYIDGAIYRGDWHKIYPVIKDIELASSFRSLNYMLLVDNTPFVARNWPINFVCIPDFNASKYDHQSLYNEVLYHLAFFIEDASTRLLEGKESNVQTFIQNNENIRVLLNNFPNIGNVYWSVYLPPIVQHTQPKPNYKSVTTTIVNHSANLSLAPLITGIGETHQQYIDEEDYCITMPNSIDPLGIV